MRKPRYGLHETMGLWCGATEARRERAAEKVGLGPLYNGAERGEEATACFWYGVGAMGQHVSINQIGEALTPTPEDIIEEVLGGMEYAARYSRSVGLMAAGDGSLPPKVAAAAWVAAPVAHKRAVWGAMGFYEHEQSFTELQTAKIFHFLGERALGDRGLLQVFRDAFTRKAAPATAMHTTLGPWVIALNLRGEALTMEVLPPPDSEGIIRGDDGRRYRVRDMAALARAINAQEVTPRVDFDHRSERRSPTFSGSTAAEGWLSNFRVSARGGLEADFALSDHAAHMIRSEGYRYLSPALMLDKAGEVTGLSSVALVNDPNFTLRLRAS